MLFGYSPHGALKQEHLVSQFQRIAMDEVHLQLRGTHFMDHRIDIQPHQLAVIINVVDDIFIFVHRLQPIRLACGLRPAA